MCAENKQILTAASLEIVGDDSNTLFPAQFRQSSELPRNQFKSYSDASCNFSR